MKLSGQIQPLIDNTAHTEISSPLPHGWWARVVCLLVISLLGAEPAAKPNAEGDATGAQLAREYVESLEKKAELTADSEFLKNEVELFEQNEKVRAIPFLDSLAVLPAKLQEFVLTMVDETTVPVEKQLANLVKETKARNIPLRESCIATRSELNSGQIALFELAVSRQVAGQFASLLNVDNRWLWLFGVLAVGTLILVRVHHYRHYYRRLSWVRRQRATLIIAGLIGCFCLVLVPTVLTWALGNRTYESLISLTQAGGGSPKSRLEKELTQSKADLDSVKELNKTRVDEHAEALKNRKTKVGLALKSSSELNASILEGSQEVRNRLRELRVNSEIEAALGAELAQSVPKLEQLKKQLEEQKAGIQTSHWVKKLTGAGLGLALLGCSIWAGLLFERRIVRERKQLASTCPRCLARGKLHPNPNQQSSGGQVAPAIRELICTNVISEDPYEECEFTFLEQHRERERLTFPTLGVASSGKTVGMLMTYHQLRNGKVYGSGSFEKLSTAGSKQFDEKVDDLINKGIVPERTILDALPPPVVFNFADNDPLGSSNALVNIFDYSGEITSHRKLTDAHRFRALNGDGYFFYLDPTYPSQDQSDALNRFREDIKTIRRLGPKEQVYTPVALCLSKIDLMVNQPYGQGDTILEFYEDLRKIEQTTENGSLERIVKRSDLAARLRHIIWPDWEIEAQIRGLFGDRFMFFPMTPIGMDHPGEENFSQRDLRPYCILEPLSWLLHMNGHPILKE